jgi:hypothetical protein
MPYFIAFQEDDGEGHWKIVVDIIADFVFLTDIVITCFSAYYDDKQGILVTDNKEIFMQYFNGWFAIDLITSTPITLIEWSISSKVTGNQYIKLIRFLRLPRLHRLVEVSKIGKFFRQMNKDSYILLIQDFF